MKSSTRRGGFTLIELMLVIGLLVVLGTVGVVAYLGMAKGARVDATKVLVGQTCEAIDAFYANMGRYPTTDKGFQELIAAPEDQAEAAKWKGPYLKDGAIPKDPWGKELHYEAMTVSGASSVEKPYHVFSEGPDMTPGNEDDIKSWTEESGK